MGALGVGMIILHLQLCQMQVSRVASGNRPDRSLCAPWSATLSAWKEIHDVMRLAETCQVSMFNTRLQTFMDADEFFAFVYHFPPITTVQ